MKKSLLLAAGFAMAISAGAQNEVGFLDSEALGLAGKPTLEAGTLLAETENVTMTFLNSDGTSAQNPNFNHFSYVVVNGEYVKLVPGIGGSTNPAGVNLTTGPSGGGCMYDFAVRKNGYIIVPSKISSNKNFYVYAGVIGADPTPIAYTLGMDLQSTDYPSIDKIVYSLPFGEMGSLDLAAANINDYTFGGTAIAWPIRIGTANGEAATGGNGTGAMIFPVFAEAEHYVVFATGSKMNTCGFIFVPDENPTADATAANYPAVSIYAPAGSDEANSTSWDAMTRVFTGEAPAAPGGGESGIADIIVNETIDENAPMFNVLGQQVDASYKGLVIKNGKKFMNR